MRVIMPRDLFQTAFRRLDHRNPVIGVAYALVQTLDLSVHACRNRESAASSLALLMRMPEDRRCSAFCTRALSTVEVTLRVQAKRYWC